jgi:hypothetical protein
VSLLSHFTLKFCLETLAATRGVSPSIIDIREDHIVRDGEGSDH